MGRARTLGLLTLTAIAGSILFPIPSAAGGGGCHPDPTAEVTQGRSTGTGSVAALIDSCAFTPTVLYVDEGATVEWTNKDIFQHTVTGAQLSWGSEKFLGQGDTIAQKFTREGVFPYYCLLHPGMVGAVVVGDPDPSDIAAKAASAGDLGIESGSTGSGDTRAAAPASDRTPASDSVPVSFLVGTSIVVGLAAAISVVLVRRRRVGQEA
jgi:plastocyanin